MFFLKKHQYYPDSINEIDINDNMGNGPYYKKLITLNMLFFLRRI